MQQRSFVECFIYKRVYKFCYMNTYINTHFTNVLCVCWHPPPPTLQMHFLFFVSGRTPPYVIPPNKQQQV